MKTSPFAKFLSVLLLILLPLQYFFGMAVTLFDNTLDNVQIPGTGFFERSRLAFDYAQKHGSLMLQLHYWNASLLLLVGLALLFVGIALRNKSIWIQTLLFDLVLFATAHFGAAFIAYHDEYYSLAMAAGFLVALGLAISICVSAFKKTS